MMAILYSKWAAATAFLDSIFLFLSQELFIEKALL